MPNRIPGRAAEFNAEPMKRGVNASKKCAEADWNRIETIRVHGLCASDTPGLDEAFFEQAIRRLPHITDCCAAGSRVPHLLSPAQPRMSGEGLMRFCENKAESSKRVNVACD